MKQASRWSKVQKAARRKRPTIGVAKPVHGVTPAHADTSAIIVQPRRSLVTDVDELLCNLPRNLSTPQIARLLWTNRYSEIAVCSLRQYAGVSEQVGALFHSLRSNGAGEVSYDRASLVRLVSTTSALAREQSRKILPFIIVAKSISWLMQRTPNRIWRGERLERRLVHKSVCIGILEEMMRCRPGPGKVSTHIPHIYTHT